MTDNHLDLLRALHAAASRGQWVHDGHRIYSPNGRRIAVVGGARNIVSIVAAHNFMPEILAELRVRRAAMNGIRATEAPIGCGLSDKEIWA